MSQNYKGHYDYDKNIISDWNNTQGGIYYLLAKNIFGQFVILYVGKAFGKEGIRQRLLQHIYNNEWSDITHFGYSVCSSEEEALYLEAGEIHRIKPKYNKLLK